MRLCLTCDQSIVGIIERSEVSHLGLASIRVLPVGEELVHRVEGVRLDSIVRGKHNEHRRFGLKNDMLADCKWYEGINRFKSTNRRRARLKKSCSPACAGEYLWSGRLRQRSSACVPNTLNGAQLRRDSAKMQ